LVARRTYPGTPPQQTTATGKKKEPALFGLKGGKITELRQPQRFFSCRSFGGACYFEFDPSFRSVYQNLAFCIFIIFRIETQLESDRSPFPGE
jgi:hypothetical protein